MDVRRFAAILALVVAAFSLALGVGRPDRFPLALTIWVAACLVGGAWVLDRWSRR